MKRVTAGKELVTDCACPKTIKVLLGTQPSERESARFWAALFADFFDDVRRDRTGVPACRRELWCGFLRFLYFALASVFVSHGG